MSDVPPNQFCSQTWINSSFIKNHLCPSGHFAITGCLKHINIHYHSADNIRTKCIMFVPPFYLENIASLANASSSGATSTILPVSVRRAHLGSSGSYTICLDTRRSNVNSVRTWRHWIHLKIGAYLQKSASASEKVKDTNGLLLRSDTVLSIGVT